MLLLEVVLHPLKSNERNTKNVPFKDPPLFTRSILALVMLPVVTQGRNGGYQVALVSITLSHSIGLALQ